MRSKKLVTHVESHSTAVSLLESGEWCYIKAINNNNFQCFPVQSLSYFVQGIFCLLCVCRAGFTCIHALHALLISVQHSLMFACILALSLALCESGMLGVH